MTPCKRSKAGQNICAPETRPSEVRSDALFSAAMRVVDASRCIRHWHDAHNDGMVVSAEHVYKLWEALEAFDKVKAENAGPHAFRKAGARMPHADTRDS